MKVAIIHDYFNQNGGAEKVVETILEIYPQSDVYTSVYIPENFIDNPITNDRYKNNRIFTTFMNRIFVSNNQGNKFLKYSKHLYWLYPLAMYTLKVSNYDLVIVSSTYCAKNTRLSNNKTLIHYCHSPVRFLHNLITERDHSTLPLWQKIVSKVILNPPLYLIDMSGVKNLIKNNAIWVANSQFIRKTVNDVYHVDSEVIYPPVEISKFSQIVREVPEDEFYLCHGRISFHKRLDLAINACIKLNKKLVISGKSALETDMNNLQKLVPEDKQDLIIFLGRTTDDKLKELVSSAKVMIFPGKEDAGIAPIEMIAGGLPVIAYKSGGALEYIEDGVNGIFFDNQEEEDVVDAIKRFENTKFNDLSIRGSITKFSKENFKTQFKELEK